MYVCICVHTSVCMCVCCVCMFVCMCGKLVDQPKGYKTNMDSFSMQITDNSPIFPMPNFPALY